MPIRLDCLPVHRIHACVAMWYVSVLESIRVRRHEAFRLQMDRLVCVTKREREKQATQLPTTGWGFTTELGSTFACPPPRRWLAYHEAHWVSPRCSILLVQLEERAGIRAASACASRGLSLVPFTPTPFSRPSPGETKERALEPFSCLLTMLTTASPRHLPHPHRS